MSDFTDLAVTEAYASLIQRINDRDVDLALMFDNTTTTNIKIGTVRWNSANSRFEKWDGTTWQELDALYNITVTQAQNADNATNAVNATNSTNATTAANANNLGGVAPSSFMRSDATDSFTGILTGIRSSGHHFIINNSTYGTQYALHTTADNGRFAIVPFDEAAWQYGREFGYNPAINKWYCDTELQVGGQDVYRPANFPSSSYLQAANNLSDIGNPVAAKSNLSLGSLADKNTVGSNLINWTTTNVANNVAIGSGTTINITQSGLLDVSLYTGPGTFLGQPVLQQNIAGVWNSVISTTTLGERKSATVRSTGLNLRIVEGGSGGSARYSIDRISDS